MVKVWQENLLAFSMFVGGAMLVMGWYFSTEAANLVPSNPSLELFLILLAVLGAIILVTVPLLYFLYLQKRWYSSD
jgi:hypothetical protein